MHIWTTLPDSFDHAAQLQELAQDLVSQAGKPEGVYELSRVKKFSPHYPGPVALLDFGLTPRHLINSARTMLRHEGAFCSPHWLCHCSHGALRKA